MTDLKLNIVCVVASVREGRLAERMIKLIENKFKATLGAKGHSLKIIDPETYNLPVLKQPLHFYANENDAPKELKELNEVIKAADAYLILTAEYNHSLPPGLTNTLNHLPPASFDKKPSGLISYSKGRLGGALACAAARPFLSELGCIPVKQFTTIERGEEQVTVDGETGNEHIKSSLLKLFSEVEWWGQGAKYMRSKKH